MLLHGGHHTSVQPFPSLYGLVSCAESTLLGPRNASFSAVSHVFPAIVSTKYFFFCRSPSNWLQLLTETQTHFSRSDDSGPSFTWDIGGQTCQTKVGFLNGVALRVRFSQPGYTKYPITLETKFRKLICSFFNEENVTIRKMDAPSPCRHFSREHCLVMMAL